MAPRFAYIGLGGMGAAMTRNLVEHGNLEHPIVLYNRTLSKAHEHSAKIGKSKVASSLEEAVQQADIIWSCLQNQEAVETMFDNILKQDIRGKLFVESSTVTPEKSNMISQRCIEAGAEFVSMPVMGEPSMAEKRLLTCIPAGPAEAVAKIKPYLVGIVARAVVDLSNEKPGSASLLKLMGNVLIMTTMETCAEVNVFAEKIGLGTTNMNKLMSAVFPNPPHAVYNERMITGGYYTEEPIVEVYKGRALTGHVLDLARSVGAEVKAYEAAVQHLDIAQLTEGPSADITGIYGAVRVKSGLPFRNEAHAGGKDDFAKRNAANGVPNGH